MADCRNLKATRAAILDAARRAFSQNGFEAATTGDIARHAGCNVALISRYFGSKEGLFRAVMEHCIDLTPLAAVTPADLPRTLVDLMLSKRKDAEIFDPMFAAIRSGSSDVALKITREEMGDPMVEALASYLEGPDARTKAALILSVIAGFDVSRHLIGPEALRSENDPFFRPRLETAIDAILRD